MREIKFRGKDKESGLWVYGSLWVQNEHSILIHSEDGWNIVYPETVGQFTDLHDKNGVEIYEGDIVKSNRYNIKKEYIGQNYEIKFGKWWHSGGWEDSYGGIGFYAQPILKNIDYRDDEPYSADNIPCDKNDEEMYDIEVIDNIHDMEEKL